MNQLIHLLIAIRYLILLSQSLHKVKASVTLFHQIGPAQITNVIVVIAYMIQFKLVLKIEYEAFLTHLLVNVIVTVFFLILEGQYAQIVYQLSIFMQFSYFAQQMTPESIAYVLIIVQYVQACNLLYIIYQLVRMHISLTMQLLQSQGQRVCFRCTLVPKMNLSSLVLVLSNQFLHFLLIESLLSLTQLANLKNNDSSVYAQYILIKSMYQQIQMDADNRNKKPTIRIINQQPVQQINQQSLYSTQQTQPDKSLFYSEYVPYDEKYYNDKFQTLPNHQNQEPEVEQSLMDTQMVYREPSIVQNRQILVVQKKVDICNICSEVVTQTIKLNCKCMVHKACLQEYLNTQAEEYKSFQKLKCPLCSEKLTKELIKQYLTMENYFKLIQTETNSLTQVQCQNCKQNISLSQEVQQSCKQIEYKCFNCKTSYCSLCKKLFHELKKDEICQSLIDQLFEAFKGQPIIVCPFCNLIQTKDDGCDHVSCSKCHKDLCAVCSVDRAPTVAHGNHYHRVGCTHYTPWFDEKNNKEYLVDPEPHKKCPSCIALKKVCPRPDSLADYKKQKKIP